MTGRGENVYLKKIMNTKVLKFFQRHVIARCHVFTSHSLLKPLPSILHFPEGS